MEDSEQEQAASSSSSSCSKSKAPKLTQFLPARPLVFVQFGGAAHTKLKKGGWGLEQAAAFRIQMDSSSSSKPAGTAAATAPGAATSSSSSITPKLLNTERRRVELKGGPPTSEIATRSKGHRY